MQTRNDISAEPEAPIEAPDGKSVVFTLSRSEANWGIGLIGGIGLVILAGAFWFAWRDGTGFPWGAVIGVAVGFLPVFGVVFWMFHRARTDRSAHLVISTKGVFAPKAAARLVPWEALDKVAFHEARYNGKRQNVFIALYTAESDRFGPKGNTWSRKMNRWWYGTDKWWRP